MNRILAAAALTLTLGHQSPPTPTTASPSSLHGRRSTKTAVAAQATTRKR
jgi:hypothetical protein